jgi:hypothetical protein
MNLQSGVLDAGAVRSYAFAASAPRSNARTTSLLASHREGRLLGFAAYVRIPEDHDGRAESEARRGVPRIEQTRLAATGAGYSVAEVEMKSR